MKDYYKILDVSETASDEEIKKAFRSLAKEWHPDVNNSDNASEKFKEINEAYSVLSNSEERNKYDFSRKRGMNYSSNMNFDNDINVGLSEFLNRAFNRNMGKFTRERTNDDIVDEILITPQETLNTVHKKKTINRKIFCEDCNGEGATDFVTCSECHGKGFTIDSRISGMQNITFRSHCQKCAGSGKNSKKHCSTCRGKGYSINPEVLDVDITHDMLGRVLEFTGMGHITNPQFPPGSAMLQVLVKEHDGFRPLDIRGNVEKDIFIDPVLGMLGGDVPLVNIEGNRLKIKIPKGIKEGQKLELKNEGMMNPAGKRGNLLVLVKYRIPNLSLKQVNILKEYLNSIKN